VLTCPLYEGAGAHEHYPSPPALAAAQRRDPSIITATEMREHPATEWLRRPPSPLAAQLRGPAIDPWEVGLRAAVARVRDGVLASPDDPLGRPLRMIRERGGAALTEWDGGLTGLAGSAWMRLPDVISPTRLEQYGACGFQFLLNTLLGIRVPEEPRAPAAIDPLVRGNLVHVTLERFFVEQLAADRPKVGEAWTAADEVRLLELLEEELDLARRRGLTGLRVFARQDERALRSDLAAFLLADSEFRRETGARPHAFEERIDVPGPRGQRFTGFVDRIDRTPDGDAVWIVDYKTGRKEDDIPNDPLAGGRRLQRPVYLLAAPDGTRATALYWYISARGAFEQARYEATRTNRAIFDRVLAAISEGVAAGSFPAVPGEFSDHWGTFDNCGYCDFTRICPRARGDDHARKADDPAVSPWAAVAAAAIP
jgi:ATP-dependent helicase/nuclease subunit B